VLGRQRHKGDAVDGVRPGGEHRNLALFVPQREHDARAVALANPVGLHGHHALRPVDNAGEIEELLHVVRDAHEPLLQLALTDDRVAAPAFAVGYLLVGQYGLAALAPVHKRRLAIDQPALEEAVEEPLAPLVIRRATRAHLAIPVQAEAHEVELVPHLGDVLLGGDARVRVVLDGEVLGGHAEGVVAHRLQHVVAFHQLVAAHRVADGVVAHVAHVQRPRGIGEHGQHVILGLVGVVLCAKDAALRPNLLPLLLYGLKRIFHASSKKCASGICKIVREKCCIPLRGAVARNCDGWKPARPNGDNAVRSCALPYCLLP